MGIELSKETRDRVGELMRRRREIERQMPFFAKRPLFEMLREKREILTELTALQTENVAEVTI